MIFYWLGYGNDHRIMALVLLGIFVVFSLFFIADGLNEKSRFLMQTGFLLSGLGIVCFFFSWYIAVPAIIIGACLIVVLYIKALRWYFGKDEK